MPQRPSIIFTFKAVCVDSGDTFQTKTSAIHLINLPFFYRFMPMEQLHPLLKLELIFSWYFVSGIKKKFVGHPELEFSMSRKARGGKEQFPKAHGWLADTERLLQNIWMAQEHMGTIPPPFPLQLQPVEAHLWKTHQDPWSFQHFLSNTLPSHFLESH